MIQRFARLQIRHHQRYVRQWENHPYRMTVITLGIPVLNAVLVEARKRVEAKQAAARRKAQVEKAVENLGPEIEKLFNDLRPRVTPPTPRPTQVTAEPPFLGN